MTALDFFDKCNEMMRSMTLDRIASFGGQELAASDALEVEKQVKSADVDSGPSDDFDEIDNGFVDNFADGDSDFADDSDGIDSVFADDFLSVENEKEVGGDESDSYFDEFSFETLEVPDNRVNGTDTEREVQNLVEDFINFLIEQDHIVDVELSLTDNWNNNFSVKANTDIEVLKLYVLMHYGVDISPSAIEIYQGCLIADTLNAFGKSKRELSTEDVSLILRNYENSWFSEEVFNSFSIETRDSELLIEVMRTNKVDTRALRRYAGVSADAIFAYLQLVLEDNFDVQLFDTQIDNGVDILKYAEHVKSGNVESICLIANRKDAAEITELLNECEDKGNRVPVALLNEYASASCLTTILRAYRNGVFNKKFIDDVLTCDKMQAAGFVYKLYEEGKINFSIYEEYGDVFQTIVFNDAMNAGLTNVRPLGMVLQEHRVAILMLLKAVYCKEYMLNSFDYAKFLTLLCSKFGTKVACWIEQGHALDSFNSFCASIIIESAGSEAKVSAVISRSLYLIQGDAVALHSLEEVIFNDGILNFVLENTSNSVQVLPENKGIAVGEIKGFDHKHYATYKFGRTSLDSAVLNKVQQQMINDDKLERCNAELLQQVLDRLDTSGRRMFTKYVSNILSGNNKAMYGMYDTSFGFIIEYFPELVFLLCAENSKYYLQTIKLISHVTDKHKFMYQFLYYVLRAKYGKQFTCKCTNLGTLTPLVPGVVVYGIKNLTYLSYKDLLSGIDGVFDLVTGKSYCILDIVHGKITIRFQ